MTRVEELNETKYRSRSCRLHPSITERSHSGLVHRSRKPEWGKLHRGFKSHPLRQLNFGLRISNWKDNHQTPWLNSKSAILNSGERCKSG